MRHDIMVPTLGLQILVLIYLLNFLDCSYYLTAKVSEIVCRIKYYNLISTARSTNVQIEMEDKKYCLALIKL